MNSMTTIGFAESEWAATAWTDDRLSLREDRVPIPPDPNGPGVSLRLDQVEKAFGAARVLKDIDLTVDAGEFVAIVGHSGSGKSTLLRVIAGLERATGGSVSVDGRALAGPAQEARLMFQEARLLPWRRVDQNVAVGRRGRGWREAARAALGRVGLADKADAWPAELSGGQKQRVALARALISEPRLLLLDEPLGALDALTRLEMQELIERVWLARRCTAVLVTHDVAEAARLADRIVALEDGRIVETWAVTEPRPRPRASAALAEIEAAILGRLLHSGA